MQTEPIAEPQQDTLVEDMAEFFSQQFEAAFDTLIERRDAAYAAAIAPLQDEQIALAQESADIEEAARGMEELLPAREQVSSHEANVLLLEGKPEAAHEKQTEAEQAAAAPGMMRARQHECEARYQDIEGEKEVVSRRVISAWLGECQAVTRSAEHGFLVVLLSGLKQSLVAFKERTSTAGWDPRFGFQGTGDLTAGAGSEAHAIGCDLYEHDYPVRVRTTGERGRA